MKSPTHNFSSAFIKLSGLLLTFIFILPYGEIDSATRDLKNAYSTHEWFLSIFIILSLSWLLSLFFTKELKLPGWTNAKSIPIFLILLTLGLSHYLGYYSFNFRPHLIDSIVQAWQAKVFAAGHIYSEYQAPASFFNTTNMLLENGRMYSQYPPGNSLLLALNFLTSVPNLSGMLLGLLTVVCSYRFCCQAYNRQIGIICLLLFACCGFFLFNTQSYMNHVPGLAFAALFMDSFASWIKSKKKLSLFMIGAALGAILITRPLEGLMLCGVFFLLTFKEIGSRSKYEILINTAIFSTSLLGLSSIYFLFNYFTTGNPFLAGYIKLWGTGHGLGFHESPWGERHTLLKGLEAFYINLKLLNEYLFESPLPPLSLLGIYLLQNKIKLNYWDKVLSLLFLLVPFIYIFYWHRDSFMGPRYTYIALAFLIPLLSKSIFSIHDLCCGKYFPGQAKTFKQVSLSNFFIMSLVLSIFFIAIIGLPIRAKFYSSSFFSMKKQIKEDLATESLSQGIIFVKVSWGTRIIAALRELGVSASLTEKAYRKVDHCDLWHLIGGYKAARTASSLIEADLLQHIELGQNLIKFNMNGDPSLRLKSKDNLSPICIEEINYDLQGYTIYEPHLLENSVDFSGPLIIARDMRKSNFSLIDLHPQTKIYRRWSPGKLEVVN